MESIMKKYIGSFLAIVLVVMGAVSCERSDYPDRHRVTSGNPIVHFVRYANTDELIEQAYMDEVVCLVGENLNSVVEIWFNDKQAILNTSFITNNTLLVSIPKEQATVQTDLIYLVNSAKETTTFPFKVLPPSPEISGMSCEYAKPGDQVTIYGKYFIELEYVEFQGADARVDVSNCSYTSTEITLTVPESATRGQIKVKTNSGLSGSVFHYLDNRGMIFDFEEGSKTAPNGWNVATIVKTPTDGVSGAYAQLGDGDLKGLSGDGSTWMEGEGGYSIPYWPGSWNDPEDYSAAPRLTDVVNFENFADMAIKFEMNISEETPWTGCALQMIPAPVTAVSLGNNCQDIYGVTVAGQNNTYYHEDLSLPRGYYEPWQATGSFDTGGKWITVTMPISEFVYDWEGGAKASGELKADSFASLLIFFHGTTGGGTDCKPIIKIDNVRAVAIK